jgi:hypothetical protein
MLSGKQKIKIEKDLYERIIKAAETAGYASPDEFIAHVLDREVAKLRDQQDQGDAEKQLRGLGYIE